MNQTVDPLSCSMLEALQVLADKTILDTSAAKDAYNFDPERVAELLKNPDVSEEDLVASQRQNRSPRLGAFHDGFPPSGGPWVE